MGTEMTVGIRQTLRMLEKDLICEVLIAKDSDHFVTNPVIEAAEQRDAAITYIDSKKMLGHICGIDTGAAVAGKLRGNL